jgi:hypothetical protein
VSSGKQGAGDTDLSGPYDVAVNPTGEVAVAELHNQSVVVYV